MSETHLNNSPIREAVIDFKFTFKEPVDSTALEIAHEKLKNLYPTKEVIDMNSLFFDVSVSNKPKFEHAKGKVGYRFISSEKDAVVQFRVDGFTFSKLRPYTSWTDIESKVKEAYLIYLEAVKVDKVIRIASRYINFLKLDSNETIDIKKYFNVYVNIPDEINSPIDNYLLRVVFKDLGKNITSIISQGVIAEQNIQTSEVVKNLILDIDCFEDKLSIDPTDLWGKVEDVKKFANKIFFNSITEVTKDRYK
ncbi:MAG: TIGR04255 family protein [Candidatus Paceibacterota bacterium]|jgi:uncharacterized protein (TIGR04255 family)